MNYYLLFYFLLIIFFEIKIPKYKNIHLSSLLHSSIVGITTNYLLINDYDKFINIYKYNLEDLNSLYYYTPYYSLIFSFVDIYESFKMNDKVFILHGLMMLFTCIVSLYNNLNHYLTSALILEVSTIFYNFVSLNNDIINIIFCIVFLFYRNILFSMMSINYMKYYYENSLYGSMSHNLIIPPIIIFNSLNFFWGQKIIRKMVRLSKKL